MDLHHRLPKDVYIEFHFDTSDSASKASNEITFKLRRTRSKNGPLFRASKAVPFRGLVPCILGIEIVLSPDLQLPALKILQAVRGVRQDKPGVRIGQIMIDRHARNLGQTLQSIDVVVGRTGLLHRLQNPGRIELQFRRDQELFRHYLDQHAAVIGELPNIDASLFKRRFRQIRPHGQFVSP